MIGSSWPDAAVLVAAVAAGALGALLRWQSVHWAHRWADRRGTGEHPFPAGVLLANTVASGVAGFAVAMGAGQGSPGRLIVVSGLCGGLSTLSTLAVDTVAIWRRREWRTAVANLVLTVVLGVGAVALGVAVGGLVHRSM